jgi:uncharacterized protein
VRLTPKGGRDAIDSAMPRPDGGIDVTARVRAPPADGEANAALLSLIASVLACPRSSLELKRGASSRSKLIIAEAIAPQEALAAFMRPLAQLRRRGN